MDSTSSTPVKNSVPPPAAKHAAPAAPAAPASVPQPKTSKSKSALSLPKLEKRAKAPKAPKAAKAPKTAKPSKAAKGFKLQRSRTAPAIAPTAPVVEAPVAAAAPIATQAAPVAEAALISAPPVGETVEAFEAAPKRARGRALTLDADLSLPSTRELVLMVAYIVGYVALAAWGMQLADGNGITPWYPAVGLAVGAATLGGSRWVAPTFIGAVFAALLDGGTMAASIVLAVLIAVGYTAAGVQLSRVTNAHRPLTRVTDAWWFIGLAIVGAPLAVSTLAVGYFTVFEGSPANAYASMVRTFVLGDALGVA
ncbi:MAG: hypothetical protein AAGC46_21655, partial [Solirubrobacteraceae bacterium]|nr:hypothetical protein [Patulibacter sp.]